MTTARNTNEKVSKPRYTVEQIYEMLCGQRFYDWHSFNHHITLPRLQAELWQETCEELGLNALRVGDKVRVTGNSEDLEAAWSLFHEKLEAILK